MNENLQKLSVVNDDSKCTLVVTLGTNSSPCLKEKNEHEFSNLDIDPSIGFTLGISNCIGQPLNNLTLKEESHGNWSQKVNNGSFTKIPIGHSHRPSGSGPLFHLVADKDQQGVVIVGTVDIDVLPTVARVGSHESLHV